MVPRLSVSLGSSDLISTQEAVDKSLNEALTSTPSPTLAIVTHTVDRNAADVHGIIRKRLPDVQIHGATTCGALLSNTGAIPNGVGILLIDNQDMAAASSNLETCDAKEATNRVAARLRAQIGDVSNILLATSPGIEEEVIDCFSAILPNARIFGGSAADNTVAGEWSLLSEDGVFSAGLSAVGMKADVSFGSCLLPPYEKGDQFATITKCQGRVIYELDGRTASEVLREWVGDSIEQQSKNGGQVIIECASFPLGVERVSGGWIAIHAAEITPTGGVGVFAEVKEGDKLNVMRKMGGGDSATAASIGIEQAYNQALKQGGLTNPRAGVLIYCGGLSIAVGDKLNDSLMPMKGKAPLLGMTAFGEQGNVAGSNLHSNLAVGVALFE
ncbi:hypothetical protein BWQ96_07903 [Gracilariopsis chorda]|uniref:FIST domain-containing protein n=1 Tax=Gracilariopsis chorda TaxID=448386 RepID=A0A2V3IK14_9FLOR|nr:hypothetical protein BWQ96_07903 [Gracilariopsis chorda]|eukprot:PXF42383.1 hypothetical protein BWQ96_07903 [Gracilariopsis chorda]